VAGVHNFEHIFLPALALVPPTGRAPLTPSVSLPACCQRRLKMDPLRWSVVGLSWWGAPEVAVFEAVAVAFEAEDFGVVDEPVDHGGGDDLVAEDLAPAAERLVAGDDEAGSLMAGGDELEEQVGGFGLEGDVAGG